MTYDAIVIPTYHRAATIGPDTLTALRNAGADMTTVHVYVGSPMKDYEPVKAEWPEVHWHWAPKGNGPAYNHIRTQWPEGAKLLSADDDILELQYLDGKRLSAVGPRQWADLTSEAFRFAEANRITLWGISLSTNPFYMSRTWKTGLLSVCGRFFGYINDSSLHIKERAKQDMELTMLHFERDGAVGRLNDFTCVTRPMRGHEGGLQHDGQRDEFEAEATINLLKRFPSLCARKDKGRVHEQDDLIIRRAAVK